jgi:hypothetical protein
LDGVKDDGHDEAKAAAIPAFGGDIAISIILGGVTEGGIQTGQLFGVGSDEVQIGVARYGTRRPRSAAA